MPRVQQGFFQALVGILVFDVLADQSDIDFALGILHALEHFGPARKVARAGIEAQHAQDDLVDALIGEHQRNLVDRVHILGGDDGLRTSTSQNSAIFSLTSCGKGRSERHSSISG